MNGFTISLSTPGDNAFSYVIQPEPRGPLPWQMDQRPQFDVRPFDLVQANTNSPSRALSCSRVSIIKASGSVRSSANSKFARCFLFLRNRSGSLMPLVFVQQKLKIIGSLDVSWTIIFFFAWKNLL